jgi:hypothetical protein
MKNGIDRKKVSCEEKAKQRTEIGNVCEPNRTEPNRERCLLFICFYSWSDQFQIPYKTPAAYRILFVRIAARNLKRKDMAC